MSGDRQSGGDECAIAVESDTIERRAEGEPNRPWVDEMCRSGGAACEEGGVAAAPRQWWSSGGNARPGSATRRCSSALSGPNRPGCAASSFASSSRATSAIHAQPSSAAIGPRAWPTRAKHAEVQKAAAIERDRVRHESEPGEQRHGRICGSWNARRSLLVCVIGRRARGGCDGQCVRALPGLGLGWGLGSRDVSSPSLPVASACCTTAAGLCCCCVADAANPRDISRQ